MNVAQDALSEADYNDREQLITEASRMRSKRGTKTPQELWSSMLQDETQCEIAMHNTVENTHAEVTDKQDTIYGEKKESRDTAIATTSLTAEEISTNNTGTNEKQLTSAPLQDDDNMCTSDDRHSQPEYTAPANTQQSPTKKKKRKTEKEDQTSRVRTRSKPRNKTPPTLRIGAPSRCHTQTKDAIHI